MKQSTIADIAPDTQFSGATWRSELQACICI